MGANDKAFADLQAMIDKTAELPELPERAAPAAAEAIYETTAKTVERGTTPYGQPWPLVRSGPRKGQKALRNAMQAVFVTAVGAKIFVRVRGIERRHSIGAVKGRVKRQIIPGKKIPNDMAQDIQAALARTYSQIMEGKSS